MNADLVDRLRVAGCVFAEDEAALLAAAARTPADLDAMVERRVTGVPLEYILGWAEFAGLRIAVDPGVFVPRRRTEFLVREAATLARQVSGRPVVVDLCCGSGALGAALAAALSEVELHAADVDPAAVRCARRNVAALGGLVYEGDLFAPLPVALLGRIDILLANVPYVPSDEIATMPTEARVHEPRAALDGGADGLEVLRRVADQAGRWLAPGGALLVETSRRQAPYAADILGRAGLVSRVTGDEDIGATVIGGGLDAQEWHR